ncbi:hypothetical protein CNECB9_750008 [Cupriavidus necator]|uniref:Uncharacterized protein n=1 Tax=Cupriavidus necator TaxID=106590 RepID=A0A1K0J3L0_CUPNE|nr:hypothetical protein CNECB9_750008 [Cupriavidus necator]
MLWAFPWLATPLPETQPLAALCLPAGSVRSRSIPGHKMLAPSALCYLMTRRWSVIRVQALPTFTADACPSRHSASQDVPS